MTVPQTMTVIEVPQAGGPEAMTLGTRPVPKPAPGEVLIEVAAAGVNRPDIVQRAGHYPPPPGATDLLGRVGVLAWNSHENYEIYFGLPGMGAVMLLLNLRLSPQDLAYVIDHSEA